MLIDTHCHLHDRQFFTAKQAETMLERARANGVEKIICIGTDPTDSLAARDFAATHDGVYWTYGVHPSEWQRWFGRDFLDNKKNFLKNVFVASQCEHSKVRGAALGEANKKIPDENSSVQKILFKPPCAIGEVGLDYHYGRDDRDQQIKLFEQMLQLATDHNLPVSFHIREAFDDFFPIIANFPNLKGVVHSFTDSKKNLRRILDQTDFYIGVNGLATYSTLPTPPLSRTLLETDAPFLTPSQFRGIINEPGYVKCVATWLAGKLDTTYEIIEQETTNNAKRLFRI